MEPFSKTVNRVLSVRGFESPPLRHLQAFPGAPSPSTPLRRPSRGPSWAKATCDEGRHRPSRAIARSQDLRARAASSLPGGVVDPSSCFSLPSMETGWAGHTSGDEGGHDEPATQGGASHHGVRDARRLARLARRAPRASPGVRLLIAKKGSARQTVSYAEALEVALCYGWIDGQKQRHDDSGWLQRFTPRGARSVWSKLNRERAEALIASGEMRPPGLAEVERAKADGRWDDAYDSQRTAVVPGDLTGRAGRASRGEGILRDTEQRQPLRDRLAAADREEGRDARATPAAVHRDAGAAREAASVTGHEPYHRQRQDLLRGDARD